MSGDRSIFAGGPNASVMDLGFGPDPQPVEPDNQDPAAGGQVIMSQEQFQQLLASLGQRRQELDYAAALYGEQVEPDFSPEIDLSQLPDPARDPDGFKAGLTQVLASGRDQIIDMTRSQVQAAQHQRSTLDDAWSLLRERHPDIAQHEDIVGLAAQREMDELRGRGIDPMVVLTNDMETAVDRIAQRANITVDRIRGLQQGDGDGFDDRTDMITGGSPRPRGRGDREEKPSQFIDELKKIQRDMGIY